VSNAQQKSRKGIPSPSSSVQPEATTVTNPLPQSFRERILDTCWPEYVATARFYTAVDSSHNTFYYSRLCKCRSQAWFTYNADTHEVRTAAKTCRLRWCPMCSKARSNFVQHSIYEHISDRSDVRFATFTLKHSPRPLKAQIDSLYLAFRQLRLRQEFSCYVTGGIWFFQVTRSKSDGLWHPHLHCLFSGDFFPQRSLSRLWADVTGDSTIVDIRSIHKKKDLARYISRYIARPCKLESLDPSQFEELFAAFHGRRLVGKWGTFAPLELSPPRIAPGQSWRNLGSWNLIVNMVSTDPRAAAIWTAFLDKSPITNPASLAYLDDWIQHTQLPLSDDWLASIIIDDYGGSLP
jgi:hypothetical protein